MSEKEENPIKRILINKSGPFPQAARVAFQSAFVEATQSGASRITIVVPSRQSFEATVPGQFLGRAIASELAKKGSATISGFPTIEFHTPTTLTKAHSADIFLAFYLNPDEVESATQRLHGLRATIFAPWMPDHLTQYQQLLNPIVIDVPDEPNA